jgi:hypothetical protein
MSFGNMKFHASVKSSVIWLFLTFLRYKRTLTNFEQIFYDETSLSESVVIVTCEKFVYMLEVMKPDWMGRICDIPSLKTTMYSIDI